MADPNTAVAEEKREPYDPNVEAYSVAQRRQDQALKIDAEREMLRQAGKIPGLVNPGRMMSVQKARQGSNLPVPGGGFFPDGVFEADSNDMFVHRRLRDGSLVMARPQEPSAVQPSPQPGSQNPEYSDSPAPAPTDSVAPAPTDTVAPATNTVAPAPSEPAPAPKNRR